MLNDEVMTGVIPSGQDWFLFGESDRDGVYGWLDGGFVGNFGVPAVGNFFYFKSYSYYPEHDVVDCSCG